MLLVLTQSDGKCFMIPIVVHQANNVSQYIYFNIPLDWIFHHPPSRYNRVLISIPEYFISTKSSICHLSSVSPLNRPFKVTMTWDFSFFRLVSSQKMRITLMDVSKTSSHCNPLQKPITTAAAKHDITLFRIFTSLFHYMSHPTNRAFSLSLVNPKLCFLINLIRSLYHLMNFPNHDPGLGHAVSVNFVLSLEKGSPIFPTLQVHIYWPIPLGISSWCPIVYVQHIPPLWETTSRLHMPLP